MPLWDKVKQELDRAGQVAQDAIDEGRIRLEAHRTRQLADRAAQTLGYAVYRAHKAGTPLPDAELGRHAARVAEYEALADRLEAQLKAVQQRWRAAGGAARPDSDESSVGTAGMGSPEPVDPTPAPPASATTPPPPETSASPPAPDPTTRSPVDPDPWRPVNPGGPAPF